MIEKIRSFQARKSLGQNFLFDENVARKIIRAIDPKPGELIVEIGPGFGILTQFLLQSECQYVGIEIDGRLIHELQRRFNPWPNFDLRHADFRMLDLVGLQGEKNVGTKIRIVGNIPYHITSSIIFAAFYQSDLLQDMVLMVQREVAERIVSQPGSKNYGILSVLSQTFSTARILFHVSKNVFIPKPEVESSVVRWDFSRKRVLQPVNKKFFIEAVKKLFGQRRKTLRNAIKQLMPADAVLEKFQCDFQRRIETLSVSDIIELSNALYEAHQPKS